MPTNTAAKIEHLAPLPTGERFTALFNIDAEEAHFAFGRTNNWGSAAVIKIRSSRLPISEPSTSSSERRRLKMLKDGWTIEAAVHENYLNCTLETAAQVSDEVLGQLAQINFEDAVVEITKTDALKVTLLIQRDPEMLLLVTRPFQDLPDVPEGHVVFSIFHQDEPISHVLPLTSLVEGLNAFLAEQPPAESR